MFPVSFRWPHIAEFVNKKIFNEKKIVIYVDFIPTYNIINDVIHYYDPFHHKEILDYKETINIFMHIESRMVIGSIHTIMTNSNISSFFNKILTFDENLLLAFPEKTSLFLPYEDYYWIQSPTSEKINNYLIPHGIVAKIFNYEENKKFEISFMCSNQKRFIGHAMRHSLWDTQENFNKINKVVCYYGQNKNGMNIYEDNIQLSHSRDKTEMYKNCMFCIVVENHKSKNYFTEKIMECFVSKTVPIYWGCPNIEKYYNIDGIIQFNKKEELYEIVNNLTIDDYYNRISAIEDNYNRWLNCKTFEEKICEIVNKC